MQDVQYVFVDSGIGGLPYLKYLQTIERYASAIYIADIKNFPYGEKTAEELSFIAVDLVGKIIKKFNPKIIVVACNTLSLASLSVLRKNFALPFVGTVPAIKVAAEKSQSNKIVLIASAKSVKDQYTKNLIEKFSSSENFILKSEQKLIQKIEDGLIFESETTIQSELNPIIEFCVNNGADCLVLGCTHFLLVEDSFKKLGDSNNVQIIESLNGVIKQTLRLSPKMQNSTESFFYITSECNKTQNLYYKKICEYFDLIFGGVF